MRKNRLYRILIVALVAAVLAFVLIRYRSRQLEDYDKNFALKDTSRIAKITIEYPEGDSILRLNKQGNEWFVNKGYPANAHSISLMMRVVSRLTMFAPVPNSRQEQIKKQLQEKGIRVKLMEEGNTLLRQYYIGTLTPDSSGTYAMIADADKPMIIHAPVLTNDLHRFFAADEHFWRELILVDYISKDLKSIRLINHQHKEKSFHLQFEGKAFRFDSIPPPYSPQTYKAVGAYANYFRKVLFKRQLDYSRAAYDSLLANPCVYTLELELVAQPDKHLRFYNPPPPQGAVDDDGRAWPYDYNHFLVIVNDSREVLLVSFIEVALLLKEREYFLGQ